MAWVASSPLLSPFLSFLLLGCLVVRLLPRFLLFFLPPVFSLLWIEAHVETRKKRECVNARATTWLVQCCGNGRHKNPLALL